MVKEAEECKFSIKLAGECDILQSNIILKSLNNARKHDNYGYLGLKCGEDGAYPRFSGVPATCTVYFVKKASRWAKTSLF